jgi:DNA-binding HxlR family transcriptional regulator
MKYSAVSEPLKLISGKWKIAILSLLSSRSIRFGELKRNLAPITHQMLSKQLKELEKDALIHRRAFDVVPPRVEYSLTEFGWSFEPILKELCKWDSDNQVEDKDFAASCINQ